MSRPDDRSVGPQRQEPNEAIDARPTYEPPRIVKKRSVSRATLASTFEGCAPEGCPALGITSAG